MVAVPGLARGCSIELVLKNAQVSLIGFLTVAFLTAKILSFLDGRRTLAILKATGLKNNEVAAVIAAEALLAPIIGSFVGLLSGWVVLNALTQQGLGLSLTPAIALSSVTSTLPAILLGIAVPSRFAQLATVVELLYERSIPLFRERIKTVTRPIPALDAFISQGAHFLKLEMVDGEFEGIVFRGFGDAVKEGEVIAHGTSWWGLKATEYVAPLDGVIVHFQEETGVVGVGPAELVSAIV